MPTVVKLAPRSSARRALADSVSAGKQSDADWQASIEDRYSQHARYRAAAEKALVLADELKKELMEELEQRGESYGDRGQHRSIPFRRVIAGMTRIVRQTRQRDFIDLSRAEALLRPKKLWDECHVATVTVQITLDDASKLDDVKDRVEKLLAPRVVAAWLPEDAESTVSVGAVKQFSQERLNALHYRFPDDVSEADLDGLLDHEYTFAFTTEKA